MAIFVGSDQIYARFIKAASAAALSKMILKEQMIKKREYKIISIYFADGYHYAWFYDENNLTENIVNNIKNKKEV